MEITRVIFLVTYLVTSEKLISHDPNLSLSSSLTCQRRIKFQFVYNIILNCGDLTVLFGCYCDLFEIRSARITEFLLIMSLYFLNEVLPISFYCINCHKKNSVEIFSSHPDKNQISYFRFQIS